MQKVINSMKQYYTYMANDEKIIGGAIGGAIAGGVIGGFAGALIGALLGAAVSGGQPIS